MTERVRAAAGVVAGVVAGVALLVWGAVVVTMIARDQPVPWSEVTLAVTTIAGALGALFVRPPARRPPQKASEVDAGELARVMRARRRSGAGMARADVAGILVMGAALAAVLVLVWSSSGCGQLRPDAPGQTRRYAGIVCSVVDAVCGSGVLPDAAQRWCCVVQLGCGAGTAVAVAVVEGAVEGADPPGATCPKTAAPRGALALDRPAWAAACDVADLVDAGELVPACEAVLSGDADGVILSPSP